MEGFLFQSLFMCMEKNTIKDAYSKLINSGIIKKVYPMVDHIDIVEFKKLVQISYNTNWYWDEERSNSIQKNKLDIK